MLTETARVVKSYGNRARVEVIRSEACGSCGAKHACHALSGDPRMEVEVINHLRASEGDRVELVLPESSLLKASFYTYGVPLGGLMGGAIIGQLLAGPLGWPDANASIIMALIGLGFGLVRGHQIEQTRRRSGAVYSQNHQSDSSGGFTG